MHANGRILSRDWDRYDTRQVIFHPLNLSPGELKRGYDEAYRKFYQWRSIFNASMTHATLKHRLKHSSTALGGRNSNGFATVSFAGSGSHRRVQFSKLFLLLRRCLRTPLRRDRRKPALTKSSKQRPQGLTKIFRAPGCAA